MLLATNLNFNLTTLNYFPVCSYLLKSLKPVSSSRFPISKFVSKEAFLEGNYFLGSKNMVEVVRTFAIRNTRDDEGVRVFEEEEEEEVEEELIDGSSQFPSGFVTNDLQSTINRLSKWLVSALFAGVILWRHDAEAMWAAMGSIVNAILSIVLKRIINQDRPLSGLKTDPGMPSSHAQSIFFILTFAILSSNVMECLGINGITLTASGFVLAFGSYLSWLRIAHQLHTTSQVVVGAAVGLVFSLFWYWLWKAFLAEAFVSSLWVQIIIILLAAALCLGFLVYVIRNWFKDER